MEISPTYESASCRLGNVLLIRGQAAERWPKCSRAGTKVFGPGGLASIYHDLDRKADSDSALAWLVREHANDEALGIAQAHAVRVELDDALRWLNRAPAQKDHQVYHIKGEPLLRKLEGDPRYQAFLQKMKLPH